MESNLVKLKSDFNSIITVRNNVKNISDILQLRIDKLSQIYTEFIKTNKNEMFVFGLDSFHFQSKLIDIEYEDMKRLFLAINNRMYCEYFKLHKIIIEYISKNITERKLIDSIKINSYPIYKDLEPFKEYKFEIVLDIHENILNLLGVIISIVNHKENELSIYKTKQNIGLNINNFIASFEYDINIMREKILMFITHIEFFHKMHSRYLKRFSNKLQLMYTNITNDIKLDDSVEISKNKKRELINEITIDNIDKKLLKDLKKSIGSETNSDEGSIISSISSPKSMNTSSDNSDNSDNSVNNNHNNETDKPAIISPTKKDLKSIFNKNISKVTNALRLFKPKAKVTEQEKEKEEVKADCNIEKIDELFFGIEESCDSIINNKSDSHDNITYSIDFEDIDKPKEIIEPLLASEPNINIEPLTEEKTEKAEIIELKTKEETDNNTSVKEEEIIDEQDEVKTSTNLCKKKRKKNKKKKN